MRRSVAFALFTVLLVPSAWFAWRNRDMPQLGRAHDDAIYYVVAKSLADGHGYRIQSLPGAPFETKYPPLVPYLLSLAWRVNPRFPENLSVAAALQWPAVPLFLWLSMSWYRRAGLRAAERWIATALLALSPFTVIMGAGIFTEVLFGVFLLASLIALDNVRLGEGAWGWAAIAGMFAGLAYLTRTAGILLLVAGPVVIYVWKKRREACVFVAAMTPAVVAWTIWVKLHHTSATDLVSLYNTDYLGFYFLNIHLRDLRTVVWTDFSQLLYSMGALLFPEEIGSFLWQMIRVTTAAAIVMGLVRHRRERALHPYMAVTALTSVELLVWHYPPNMRLMYPLAPLFAAGAIWEGEHLVKLLSATLRRPERGQRVAGSLVGALAATLLVTAIWMQGSMTFATLPEMRAENIRVRRENTEVYQWIASNLPLDATVLSINPAVYLYTDRRTTSLIIMPIYWYLSDARSTLAQFETLSRYASAHGLHYIYLHWVDYQLLTPDHAQEALRAVQENPALCPLFKSGQGTLFQPCYATRLSQAPGQ